jgi:hypothetical protein
MRKYFFCQQFLLNNRGSLQLRANAFKSGAIAQGIPLLRKHLGIRPALLRLLQFGKADAARLASQHGRLRRGPALRYLANIGPTITLKWCQRSA